MTRTHTELLDGFLADPTDPRWSSAAMSCMFAAVEGDSKTKLLTVLKHIDDRLVVSSCTLTTEQTNFLREVTLFAYTSGCASDIKPLDIAWLMTRLQSEPTPQRALALAMLVPYEKLPVDAQSLLLKMLHGTPGERILDAGVVGQPRTA